MTKNSTENFLAAEDLYVQYGCGLCAPEGWLNFDASPNLFLERLPILGSFYASKKFIGDSPVRMRFPDNVHFGDIISGLPVKNASVKGVYASHVLEHLSLEDFRTALKNTFAMLKPEGKFRLVVPDLKLLTERYVNSFEIEAATFFVKEIGMGVTARPRGLKGILQVFLGNGQHLWMWDYNSMKLELEKIGFINIRQAHFNDSEDPIFRSIEQKERFLDALAVQCQKPL